MKILVIIIACFLISCYSCNSGANSTIDKGHKTNTVPKYTVIKTISDHFEILLTLYKSNTDSMAYAKKMIDSAINLDSTYHKLYADRAQVEIKLNKLDDAINDFDKALKLKNDIGGYYSQKGFLLEKEDKIIQAQRCYLEAIDRFDKKLATDSLNVGLLMKRAVILMLVKGQQEGINEYEKIVRKFPNDPTVLAKRGDFYNFDRKKFIESFK